MRAWRLAGCDRWGTRSLVGSLIVAPVLAAAVLAAAPLPALAAPAPVPVPLAAGVRYAGALRVNVRGAGLVDAGTGVRLWAQDFNVARPMGSITKVMTAQVVPAG